MPPAPFPNLRRWQLRYSGHSGRRRGQWLMHGDTRRSTVFSDLDTWPPSPVLIHDEYVTSFDVLPDGRLVVCSMLTQPPSEYAVRIHAPGWPANPTAGGAEVIPCPVPGGIFEVHVIGGEVIALDLLIERDHSPELKRAYALKAERFRPVAELPEVRTFERPADVPRFGPPGLEARTAARGRLHRAADVDTSRPSPRVAGG